MIIISVQLYLYAQSNGRSSLTLDEISSTSIRYSHQTVCSKNIKYEAFYVFHIFCWLLPFIFYFLTSLVIQSCRPRIRQILGPSTPRNSVNQNYTALVLIGLIFSIYALVLDGFAIKAVIKDETLKMYEEKGVVNLTIVSIVIIFFLDFIAIIISFVNIFILLCVDSECCEKYISRGCKSNCKHCCILCFFCCCLWKILKCQKNNCCMIEFEDETQPGKRSSVQDLESETTTWLLMTSFMAPITCLGTHSGFIVIAWASDPVAAGSMTIFFVLSFVYYYFGIRQLYIVLVSRCRKEDKCCTCVKYFIREPDQELDEYHENLKPFNFKALCIAIPLTGSLALAQGLSIAAYVLLPSSLVSLPSSLFNVLHWALILGSALIAYRLLTVRPPYQETIAENIVKSYYTDYTNITKEYDKELGRIVGKALNKSYPPTIPPSQSHSSASRSSDSHDQNLESRRLLTAAD